MSWLLSFLGGGGRCVLLLPLSVSIGPNCNNEMVFGTSVKSSRPRGAVRISLRARPLRALPRSATSDREVAALQSTRKVPSTATVGRERERENRAQGLSVGESRQSRWGVSG